MTTVVSPAIETPWTQGTLVRASVETPWAQAVLVVSTGNPFTPIDPPAGSTPTAPNLDPTYILPAQDVYGVVHEVVVTDLRDDSVVELQTFSIAADDGSVVWTLSAAVPGSMFASLTAPGDPPVFRISIDGLEWVFVIEGINRSRQFPSATLNITGRSQTITAGAPYEYSRNWTNDGPTSAAQLVDQAQIFNGLETSWLLDDWLVPDLVWTFAGTPLEVAQRVAATVDAVVVSDRSGNRITIMPRYRELPNEWSTTPPDVEIHIDAAMVDSYQRADNPAYNSIYVSGQQQGAIAYVHLAGTLGDKLAPLVTDLLLTDVDACRQRGFAELGKGGPGALVGITLPVLTGGTMPGVLNLGDHCHVIETGVEEWWGIVRAVTVSVDFPSVQQAITLERHTTPIDGTVLAG